MMKHNTLMVNHFVAKVDVSVENMKCRIYFEPVDVELTECSVDNAIRFWEVEGLDIGVLRVILLDKNGLPVKES